MKTSAGESPLWRWRELCEALSLEPVSGPDITGISIDSRSCAAGDLFIALTGDPGPRFNPSQRSARDGHSFIGAALQRGAAGVLVHDQKMHQCPQLQIGDTLDALWDLGRAARLRLNCPVVAVTGSSGKTTTKSLLAAALQAFSSGGSLNNHLGVPLSLARSPREATAAVFEIGTNHPGEIAPLSQLVRPDIAVVLNVHPAHAANFASLDELRVEKLSIVAGLAEKGVLIVEDQVDDSALPAHIPRLRFGTSTSADVTLLDLSGQSASYQVGGYKLVAHVPGGGQHRALSLAAVLAVMLALGRNPEDAANLSDNLLPLGRGTTHQIAGIQLIDDSYNANPVSMRAALKTLQSQSGRRYALLGEMLELGNDSPRYHHELNEYCAGLDGVFCVGAGMQVLAAALDPVIRKGYWEQSGDSLIEALIATLKPGDNLLIKGSNRVFWTQNFVQRLTAALGA